MFFSLDQHKQCVEYLHVPSRILFLVFAGVVSTELASKATSTRSFCYLNDDLPYNIKMETAFYDDGRTYNPASSNNSGGNSSKDEVRKRLTLDLNSPRLKKTRFDALLSSPDLNMLKLPSPELEKLIMQQNGLLSATPTPSGFSYPPVSSNSSNTRGVTRDQEMYVRGFDDALAELHQAANQAGSNNNNNSAGQQQQGQHHSMETGSSNTTAFPHTQQQQRPSASSSPYPINTLPGLQVL